MSLRNIRTYKVTARWKLDDIHGHLDKSQYLPTHGQQSFLLCTSQHCTHTPACLAPLEWGTISAGNGLIAPAQHAHLTQHLALLLPSLDAANRQNHKTIRWYSINLLLYSIMTHKEPSPHIMIFSCNNFFHQSGHHTCIPLFYKYTSTFPLAFLYICSHLSFLFTMFQLIHPYPNFPHVYTIYLIISFWFPHSLFILWTLINFFWKNLLQILEFYEPFYKYR